MGQIFSFCNQKGGVGKTTTAVNLATSLAQLQKKILLIDIDPQGNATSGLGIEKSSVSRTVYNFMVDDNNHSEIIMPTCVTNLDLIPSNPHLSGAEIELISIERREFLLKNAVDQLKENYDFILIDCPPSLGLLTVNALVAADSTIIPVQCEYLALEGLNGLMRAVNMIKQNLNPGLRVGGIVLTMTDFRANLAREVADEVKRFFKDLVFDTSIPRNIRLAESPSFGKPICLYDPHSTGAVAYQLLAQEVLAKEGMRNDEAIR